MLFEAARRSEGSGDDILGDNGACRQKSQHRMSCPQRCFRSFSCRTSSRRGELHIFGTVLGIELRGDLTVNKIIMDDTVDARDVCSGRVF